MSANTALAILRERARARRRNPTSSEASLWRRLRKQRLGVRFRRQHVVYPYIADFYCHSKRLCVEVDGPCHDQEADHRRDAMIHARHDVETLRFSDEDVEFDVDGVVAIIRARLLEGPR